MRSIHIILRLVLATIMVFLAHSITYSQSTEQNNSDERIRIYLASFYIESAVEPRYLYSTPLGEATANIILSYFRETLEILELNITHIEATDQIGIVKLKAELQELLINPPSWNDIIIKEEKRLCDWHKASRRQSLYKQ